MVKFAGVYQLPAAIAVTPSVLAKPFRASVAGVGMVVTTPRVVWDDAERPPRLVAPEIHNLPTRRGAGISSARPSWDEDGQWGSVPSWRPTEGTFPAAWVRCVALTFALPAGSFDYLESLHTIGTPHGGTVADVFENIDEWFLDLLQWIGVARDQDTDHLDPLSTGEINGEGLTLRAIESDGRTSSPANASVITITQTKHESINLAALRSLIRLVDRGARPHDSHLLLRQAHLARRRGKNRVAVIDAGTAVELVLAEWNVHSNGNKQPPARVMKTLGWYIREARALVPRNTKADLVDVRNNAVHNNYVPTLAEVQTALEIAGAIVRAIEPLPV